MTTKEHHVKSFLRILIVFLATGAGLPALGQAPPSYLVLRTPHGTIHSAPGHQGGHVPPRGVATTVHHPTYAYGWFGAAPRQHWSRHTGYYRNYTQWSAR